MSPTADALLPTAEERLPAACLLASLELAAAERGGYVPSRALPSRAGDGVLCCGPRMMYAGLIRDLPESNPRFAVRMINHSLSMLHKLMSCFDVAPCS
jgi:hypothetical protein